ncbi:hypothetical protein FQA39_LY09964 [Lamprigera yunnana]|nr:hypothetical protein FQA39_LY09964 [Lamprigera yunnana]
MWVYLSSSFSLDTPRQKEDVEKYLILFGYLDEAKSYSINETFEGLSKYQKFFGLPVTGRADQATLELMQKPRCGMADPSSYVINSPGFPKRNLTFTVSKYSQKISKKQIDEDVALSFQRWAEASGLTFTRVEGKADLDASFTPRYHGDGNPFDGPGGVLAHAFYPNSPRKGQTHFDKEENWKHFQSANDSGIDFFSVSLHEFGHSLGLGHSNVYDAVMYPYYRYNENKTLQQDDIDGIKAIYRLSETTVYVITTLGSVNLKYFFWRAIGNVKGNDCGTIRKGG